MGKLIYSTICSLDGYVEDSQGKFDWAAPDEEVHSFVNELERPVGVYLYGRGMYETMAYWETGGSETGRSPVVREFAEIWRTADKVVYSRTLSEVATTKTRLEREFDPAAVRRMKLADDRNLSVGGSGLAAQALASGLVDELALFVMPVVVGSGKPALPSGLRLQLKLVDHRSFDSGTVYVHYRLGDAA